MPFQGLFSSSLSQSFSVKNQPFSFSSVSFLFPLKHFFKIPLLIAFSFFFLHRKTSGKRNLHLVFSVSSSSIPQLISVHLGQKHYAKTFLLKPQSTSDKLPNTINILQISSLLTSRNLTQFITPSTFGIWSTILYFSLLCSIFVFSVLFLILLHSVSHWCTDQFHLSLIHPYTPSRIRFMKCKCDHVIFVVQNLIITQRCLKTTLLKM